MKTPDLFGEIIPGVQAAGFFIGSSIELLQGIELIADKWRAVGKLQIQQAIFAADKWLLVEDIEFGIEKERAGRNFYYFRGAVKLHYNELGVLDLIQVSHGYRGKFGSSIGISSPLSLVQTLFPIEYDETEEVHFPTDYKESLLISFYAEERSLLKAPTQKIESIFIHNYEM